MGTDVATAPVFGGKVSIRDMQALAAKAQESAQNNPRGGAPDGSDYLNFSGKRGVFTIGKDSREIQPDEHWIVNVTSFEEGWVCWKGGSPASLRMSNIYTGVPVAQPDSDELGPFDSNKGEGWFGAKAWVMKSCDEEQQGYMRINSVSGVSAMAELIGEFSERAAAGEPCWPVIHLDKEQFESKGFKNFKPVFEVVTWLTTEDMEKIGEGADPYDFIGESEEEEEEAPKPKAKATPRRRRRG